MLVEMGEQQRTRDTGLYFRHAIRAFLSGLEVAAEVFCLEPR